MITVLSQQQKVVTTQKSPSVQIFLISALAIMKEDAGQYTSVAVPVGIVGMAIDCYLTLECW